MAVVFYLMVLLVLYLGHNLIQVQAYQKLRNHPPPHFKDFVEMAMAYHVGSKPLPALRGAILDSNHQILAQSLTLPSIAADPSKIPPSERPQTALFLARATHGDEHAIRALLNTRGTFVWIGRKKPERVAERVEKLQLHGIFILREPSGQRFYPKGRLAVHILGYTGIDDNGLDGIEAMFDPVLKGEPGQLEAEMDREGRVIPNGWSHLLPARPGRNIVLTINEPIQYVAERQLSLAVKKWHATSGSCIVLDVKTGDVLALVNKPDYATRDSARVETGLRRNHAISDTYEPGSTFKIITGCAALDSGHVTMADSFFCGSSIQVDGWTIHNADDGETSTSGTENLMGIITHSYNVGTTSVALRIGKKALQEAIVRFGLGQVTGISLPGEAEGLVQPFRQWANITLATNSYGQGITVTPIQLACVMQAVANNGIMMKPRLVKEIRDADGRLVKDMPPTVKRRVISENTARQMREILRNVVAHGTGKNAENAVYPSAGKTGTANIVEGGAYGGRYNGSFLGFAPYDEPRIVVLVKIEDPKPYHWGGTVAAPVFRAVARDTLWRLGVRPLPVLEKEEREAAARLSARGGRSRSKNPAKGP